MPVNPKISRNALWFALAVLVVMSISWSRSSSDLTRKRFGGLPVSGTNFASASLPLSEVERQVFLHAEVAKRLYDVGTNRFVLTAIDGSRNRHAVHDPRFCFRGAGWEVALHQTLPLPGGTAEKLTLARRGEKAEVVYWFAGPGEQHSSAMRAWWKGLLRRVTFGACGYEPALVVLQPTDTPTLNWSDVLAQAQFLFDL